MTSFDSSPATLATLWAHIGNHDLAIKTLAVDVISSSSSCDTPLPITSDLDSLFGDMTHQVFLPSSSRQTNSPQAAFQYRPVLSQSQTSLQIIVGNLISSNSSCQYTPACAQDL
jgi:hypothetical protein